MRQERFFSAVSEGDNSYYSSCTGSSNIPETDTLFLLGGNVQLVAMLSVAVTTVLLIGLGCFSGLSAENTKDSGSFITSHYMFF